MHRDRATGKLGNGRWVALAGFYSRIIPDTIDFRFSAESPALLSAAHTVSAKCVMSLSASFRFQPKVKFLLLVDLLSNFDDIMMQRNGTMLPTFTPWCRRVKIP